LDAIFQDIDPLLEKWQQESSDFDVKREQLLGDSIIFCFYLVFCGSLTVDDRASALAQVRDLVVKADLTSSSENPTQLVRDQFLFSNPDKQLHEVVSAQVDARHVRRTIRCPLLVDPDGVVTSVVTGSIKPAKLIVVSQKCAHLEAIMSSAVSDGKTLVLLNADELNPIVNSVLALSLVARDAHTSAEVRVGSKLTTWNPKFKLILVSMSSQVDQLPDALLARVTLIDVSSASLAVTRAVLLRTFLEFFEPDIAPRHAEMQLRELSQCAMIHRSERRTLESLIALVAARAAKPDHDCLAGEETITALISSRDVYSAAVKARRRTRSWRKRSARPSRRSRSTSSCATRSGACCRARCRA
jgi:hypothetical protein